MRDVFSKIKYQVSCSETSLRRANKHRLTIKMAIQLQEKQNLILSTHRKAYKVAKKFAEKALALLNITPNSELLKRTKEIIDKCNTAQHKS